MRTLIVEDVHFLSMILERFLGAYGYCETAADGMEAIEKYSRGHSKGEPFDLMCLDILLPEMNGFEVLKNVRKFESEMGVDNAHKVKVVVISTFNDSETVAKAKAAGCDRYISKPFTRQKVIGEIVDLGLIKLDQLSKNDKKLMKM